MVAVLADGAEEVRALDDADEVVDDTENHKVVSRHERVGVVVGT